MDEGFDEFIDEYLRGRRTVREYFEQLCEESGWIVPSDLGADTLKGQVARALLDGLERLDALPRSDAFWNEWLNAVPTESKVQEFCRRLLTRDPGDTRALWCLHAVNLLACENDFGMPWWRALHRLGEARAEWVLESALSLELRSGIWTHRRCPAFLQELGLAGEARPILERWAVGNSQEAWWARDVLAGLAQ